MAYLQQATAGWAGVYHLIQWILSWTATDAREMGVIFHQIIMVTVLTCDLCDVVPVPVFSYLRIIVPFAG